MVSHHSLKGKLISRSPSYLPIASAKSQPPQSGRKQLICNNSGPFWPKVPILGLLAYQNTTENSSLISKHISSISKHTTIGSFSILDNNADLSEHVGSVHPLSYDPKTILNPKSHDGSLNTLMITCGLTDILAIQFLMVRKGLTKC